MKRTQLLAKAIRGTCMVVVLAMAGSIGAAAQSSDISSPRGELIRKIAAEKKTYLVNRLVLQAAEKDAFFEIYNDFNREIIALHENKQNLEASLTRTLNMADDPSDMATEALRIIETDMKIVELRKDIFDRLMGALGPQKAALWVKAESDWVGELRQIVLQYQNRQNEAQAKQ